MTPFSTLSAAIQAALAALDSTAGVSIIQEDSQNIAVEIQKATGSVGMMILLGIPGFKNKDAKLSSVVNADLTVEILVREVPAIWRRKANANAIHCSDLGQAIAPALQGLVVTGFEDLRVLGGYPVGNFAAARQGQDPLVFQDYVVQLETMQVFE